MSNVLEQLNEEMASVVRMVQLSTVQIQNGSGGAGSATIWHPEGLIVTNAHVAQGQPLTATLSNGLVLPAQLLAYDSVHDLAALSVKASGLPTFKLGNSRQFQAGQWVMALGNPFGVRDAVTAGVVIGMQAEWRHRARTGREWIAVALHLRPGYSGGPLLDVQGRLLGINTMMTSTDVGMAVPVHVVKAFLREN